MVRAASDVLAPVYPYLAEYVVQSFDLAGKSGIGLDIGGGPGNLVVELAGRTPGMFWVNADINPHHHRHFFASAEEAGVAHRVGAMFADVHRLPFRDAYADVVVSRGSYHFWKDMPRAFAEIWRILKPGGSALIGRGLPANMPLDEARSVRARQKGGPRYSVDASRTELRELASGIGAHTFEVLTPHREQGEVNYGIWLVLTKPGD